MDFIQLVVLAVIQGLTEFLPISSSGHLILPSEVLGWPDQGLAFDVAVHVGSLIAVLAYFRRDVWALLTAWFGSLKGSHTDDSKLAWFVILGTIPAGLAGLMFNDFIEANLRSIAVIATTTIVFGLVLGWADKTGSRKFSLKDLNIKNVLIIGCAQALALIPGTSRSGITITAALALGLDRKSSARFSFFLSIPLIVLSGGFKALELMEGHAINWGDIFLGVLLSALSAAACIHLFMSWIDRIGMMPFVIYRLVLGLLLFTLILF